MDLLVDVVLIEGVVVGTLTGENVRLRPATAVDVVSVIVHYSTDSVPHMTVGSARLLVGRKYQKVAEISQYNGRLETTRKRTHHRTAE